MPMGKWGSMAVRKLILLAVAAVVGVVLAMADPVVAQSFGPGRFQVSGDNPNAPVVSCASMESEQFSMAPVSGPYVPQSDYSALARHPDSPDSLRQNPDECTSAKFLPF